MNHTEAHTNSRSSTSKTRWLVILLIICMIPVVLLSIARISLPYALVWGTLDWFESQGLEASIDDIEISLLKGQFKLHGLVATSSDAQVLELGSVSLGWSWDDLLEQQLKLHDIQINTITLAIKQHSDGRLNIAGIQLPESETQPQTQAEQSAWGFALSRFSLDKLNICFSQLNSQEKTEQQLCQSIDGLQWQGSIQSVTGTQSTESSPQLLISGNLSINEPISCFTRYDSNQNLMDDYCAYLETLNWAGDIYLASNNTSATSQFIENNQIELQHLRIEDRKLKRQTLELSFASINKLNIDASQKISASAVQFNQLRALPRHTEPDDQKYILHFKKLLLNDTAFANSHISIKSIELSDIGSFLLINSDGSLETDSWLSASNKQKQTSADRAEQAQDNKLSYSIGSTNIQSNQHIVLLDKRGKEPFRLDLHDIQLDIGSLDSRATDKMTRVKLDTAIDKHGLLNLNTELTPFSSRPSLQGEAEVSGLDLRLFSPITRQAIGHTIHSGQLDSTAVLNVDQGKINSTVKLTLNQFKLKPLSKQDAEKLNSEFGFPLNSSLSLLRDRDNSIRLEIPVSGDIESPEFDPRDAIMKATSKAISTAVLYYYTPFGLVFATEALFNLATALNFEPVLFEAGLAQLTETHQQTLQKLGKLMKDRPGIHLTLCAQSNRKDMLAITGQTTDIDKNTEKKDIAISDTLLNKLITLANQRSDTVKAYLIEQQGIKASRLIECTAEYNDDARPSVDISI